MIQMLLQMSTHSAKEGSFVLENICRVLVEALAMHYNGKSFGPRGQMEALAESVFFLAACSIHCVDLNLLAILGLIQSRKVSIDRHGQGLIFLSEARQLLTFALVTRHFYEGWGQIGTPST